MEKENILGFDVTTYNVEGLINSIYEDYIKQEQLFIVNINPEIIVANYKNKGLKEIFNNQKYQIPDGTGILWASKKQKGHIVERITGIDLMLEICRKSKDYKSKIYLYGSKPEIANRAKEELKKMYPGINVIGSIDGYLNEDIALKQIQEAEPDILFVGLGSPKQEQFIIKHKDELKSIKIFMPVGGSFDVISKTKKRAPKWIIKHNLEWLYRAIQEPKRIFRQIKLIKFMYLVKKEKRTT